MKRRLGWNVADLGRAFYSEGASSRVLILLLILRCGVGVRWGVGSRLVFVGLTTV
jgi:hypothetical protein